MPSFAIHTSDDGQCCELLATGEIDIDVANQLITMGLLSLGSTDAQSLVIDLADVSFIDSTGLGALVIIRNEGQKLGKDVMLRNVPERVETILAIAGLTDVFGLRPEPVPVAALRRRASRR